jgi:hypothetical protein
VLLWIFMMRSLRHNVYRRYTAIWNFAYVTNAAGAIDDKGCILAPYTYQYFVLNATFDAQQLPSDEHVLTVTTTTQLPVQPTGLLPVTGSTSSASTGTGSTPTTTSSVSTKTGTPPTTSQPPPHSSAPSSAARTGRYSVIAGFVGVVVVGLGWLA